ncbi:hypothetical protein ABZ093_33890 [Streptomyces cyaneofuscatus]|uniref:hypothetical protein n=1 Tax=Streptomyces cyaneofuscatus TaxID=66883 RepID=UPI0033AFB2D4
MNIGTAAGAIAAIGSLAFTGVATYYGAVIARQQLDQSKEESEQKAQDQASKVTFWEENSDWAEKNGALHMVNRSPDPVTEASVYFRITYKGKDHLLLLPAYSLPPCTEMVFPMEKQKVKLGGRWATLSDMTHWDVPWMFFADSSGKSWARGLTRLAWVDEEGVEALTRATTKQDTPMVVTEPQPKRVEPCGAAN